MGRRKEWLYESSRAVNSVDGLPRAASACGFSKKFGTKWLVETEIAFSVEEQHFIGTTAGEITAKVLGAFPEIFAQNLEYLAALWLDLDEKLSCWS